MQNSSVNDQLTKNWLFHLIAFQLFLFLECINKSNAEIVEVVMLSDLFLLFQTIARNPTCC